MAQSIKMGNIIQYFPSLHIAIIELATDIHVGDRVKFQGQSDFTQMVDDLKIDSENINFAKTGETVGLKVRQPVFVGDELIKLM